MQVEMVEPEERLGNTNALAKLEGAILMLAQAKTLDEVKAVVDLAEAAKTYARAAKLGHEAQNHAAEIALEGKRKAGAILAKLDKSSGGRPSKTADKQSGVSEYRRTINEANVEDWEAQRWQRVAEVDDEVFEKYMGKTKSDGGEITEIGLLQYAKPAPKSTVQEEAVETGFLTNETANETANEMALSNTGACGGPWLRFENAVRRALKAYLSQGGDKQSATEVLRRLADELTVDDEIDEEVEWDDEGEEA